MKPKVIIIGAGLGGLECGYILCKHGFQVTILEQNMQIGGCLQSFMRQGIQFDTGFHYVGGLAAGEPLYEPFQYFGLLDLPWQQMDACAPDEPSLTLHLTPDTPPDVIQHIREPFCQSSWRLVGGGQLIADHLAQDIEQMGGVIRRRSKVVAIHEENKRASGVTYLIGNGLQCMQPCDYIISDIHPMALFQLLPQDTSVRNIYRKRIAALPNSFGIFTAHLRLRKGAIPYENRNIMITREGTNMRYLQPSKTEVVMLHFYPHQSAADILTPMFWEDVKQWENTYVGHRGKEYKRFKEAKLNEMLDLAETQYPHLREAIEATHTSSPLTYRDYTGTYQGSAFGILKDGTERTMLSTHTPLPNLFLTGQNVNLHGVLGVTMTAFETCKELIKTSNSTF